VAYIIRDENETLVTQFPTAKNCTIQGVMAVFDTGEAVALKFGWSVHKVIEEEALNATK
jgi:hypothetical protein